MADQLTYATKVGFAVFLFVAGGYLCCGGALGVLVGLGVAAEEDAKRQVEELRRAEADAQFVAQEAEAAKRAEEAARAEAAARDLEPMSEKEAFEAELFAAERAFAPDTDER